MTPAARRHAFLTPRRPRKRVSGFASLGELVIASAEKLFTPPENITVAAAAEKYVQIEKAGAFVAFDNTTAPYMIEPMNMTQSREHSGLVFVSSAQSGKTASLVLNTVAYNAIITGMDTMVVCQSSSAATDFAIRRVDRMITHTPALKGEILPVRNSDNQKRKQFRNGMLLTLSHPSKNELSGKPIGCVIETDYDRMDDDIDGEGNAWGLGSKRTETFGSYAMTIAESSPSRAVNDPKRILEPHEAPDAGGILALYNQGDRRLWYWPCPACDQFFTPQWELVRWDEKAGGHLQQANTAYMECPSCAHHIHPDDRHDMQQWGVWRAAPGRITSTVSYWLEGTAAAFTTWPKLVERYLDALKTYTDTLDETGLTKFYNTDLGRPYVPKSEESGRLPEVLMGRKEDLGERVVPEGVVCLVACIDVQKNMWVVQVHGIQRGNPADIIVVDRFDVSKSTRIDADGDHFMVRPASYQEDWELLVEAVILRTYPLADGSGRRMQVKLTLCDSGGMAAKFDTRGGTTGSGGVTEKAYQFWRDLSRRGLGARFHLVRGSSTRTGKRAWIDRPDSSDRGKFAIARGDVPVLYLNSNECKDVLAARLDVLEPGAGRIAFPDWLENWFFGELCAEYRDDKGWHNPKKRNEAWDLLYYLIGCMFSPLLPLDKIKWDNPPPYLLGWDENPFVLPAPDEGESEDFAPARAFERKPKVDFAALGAAHG